MRKMGSVPNYYPQLLGDAELLGDALDQLLQGGELGLEPRDVIGGSFLLDRLLDRLELRRAAEKVSPAVFARAGLARQLHHQRTCRPRLQLVQETFHR